MSIDELRKAFTVDPIAGKIFWAISQQNKKPGDEAGYTPVNSGRATGRVLIRYNYKGYARSRLMFALVHGRWPINVVDHIDRNPNNDAIANLRDVTNKENLQNVTKKPTHGIYWDSSKQSYCIDVCVKDKRSKRTGFKTIAEAIPIRDQLCTF